MSGSGMTHRSSLSQSHSTRIRVHSAASFTNNCWCVIGRTLNLYVDRVAVSWPPALIPTHQVMLLEVDFAGKNAQDDPIHRPAALRKGMGKARLGVLKDIEAAGAFLKKHETAKIIVSIDTHCIEENGLLVWSDDNPDKLGVCSMKAVGVIYVVVVGCTNREPPSQVLRDCIPPTVYQYLSDARGSPVHSHKSIILNLACGATIRTPKTRSEIFEGYAISYPSSPYTYTWPGTVPMLSFHSQMRSHWSQVFRPPCSALHHSGSSQTRTMTSSLLKHSRTTGAHSTGLSSHGQIPSTTLYTQPLIPSSQAGVLYPATRGVAVTTLILRSCPQRSRSSVSCAVPHVR